MVGMLMGDHDSIQFAALSSNLIQSLFDPLVADSCIHQNTGRIRTNKNTVSAAAAGYTNKLHLHYPS